MTIDYKLIDSRIKLARKRNDMTQEKLAERLDVSVGYVSQVERGITKVSLDLLASISEFVSDASVASEKYLSREISQAYDHLSNKERKLIYGIIQLLLDN